MPLWSPLVAWHLLFIHRRNFAPRLLRGLAVTWITLITLALSMPWLYKFWPFAARAWDWWLD